MAIEIVTIVLNVESSVSKTLLVLF